MLSPELREMIVKFIDNEIQLRDLEDWVMPRSRSFISDPNSADADVMAAIDLCLAEFNDGIRDEQSIKAYLAEVLQKYNVIYLEYPQPQTSRTDALAMGNSITASYTFPSTQNLKVADRQSRGYTSP